MTNSEILPTSGKDLRSCERVGLFRDIKLQLEDGREIFGKTQDISLSGIMIDVPKRVLQNIVRSKGEIYLLKDAEQISKGFPCEVIRVKESYVALKLSIKHAASFGLALTKDLLVHN